MLEAKVLARVSWSAPSYFFLVDSKEQIVKVLKDLTSFGPYLYIAETWNTSSNPRPSVGSLGKGLSIVLILKSKEIRWKTKGSSCSSTFQPSGFKESSCNAGDPSSVPGLGRSTREGIGYPLQYPWASLVAQLVKNPPAMWDTWVWSLGWEDPLWRERLPTPVFWPGEFHGLYSPWGHKELDTTEQLSLSSSPSTTY